MKQAKKPSSVDEVADIYGNVVAHWAPGWNHLDEGLRVGEVDEFWFDLGLQSGTAHFANSIWFNAEREKRTFAVDRIIHEELGDLVAVDTSRFGFYEFILADGRSFEVAVLDPKPGQPTGEDPQVASWSLTVDLSPTAKQPLRPNGYWLAISRQTHVGEMTISEYRRQEREWQSQRWWKRFSAPPKRDNRVHAHLERTGRVYRSEGEAMDAAKLIADQFSDQEDLGVGVDVYDAAGEFVGGWWAGDGGMM